jgi:hypothetical protein
MKRMNPCRLVITLALFSVIATCNPLQAQVYKVVDENGNVTYTDRPPAEGAKPVDLPPLSVVEAPDYEQYNQQRALEKSEGAEEDGEVPLRTLRNIFKDFAIISPGREESIWNPQQPIPVAWSVSSPLKPGMMVSLSVDGVERAKTSQSVIAVDGLERGEHTITAELVDARNRKVATAQPVVFFVRRPSIYNNPNRPRPTPRG